MDIIKEKNNKISFLFFLAGKYKIFGKIVIFDL